jgi:hypothetical protein
MKAFLILVLATFSTFAIAENYGAPVKAGKPTSLESAIKQLDKADSADVLVAAKVEKICVVKGCWMGLVSSSGDVRVTFKDYAFFVPPSLIGKQVVVDGKLQKVTMTLDETKHYVKDAGGDPATVTQPRVEYRIVANGVEVKG